VTQRPEPFRPATTELGTEHLLGIIELATEIAEARLDLSTVLRLVVERARTLTGADGAAIELVDGEQMVYRAVSGTATSSLGLRLERARSLSGLCVQEARPLCALDTETDPRVDRDACRRVGVRSMVCAPLLFDGDAIGALKVMSRETHAFFDQTSELLQRLARVLAAAIHQSQHLAAVVHDSLHDSLTGLGNRRAFERGLELELSRNARYARGLCLVTLDLDGFKLVNDQFGHAAGDEVLVEVACILRQCVRETDGCFRLGGDEFALVLPETDQTAARGVVQRVTRAVQNGRLGHGLIGISAGIAECGAQTREQLLAEADAALYAEKHIKHAAR
jgi:diguanylate cyclase (GGDEF)-like protein